ncbi:1,6-anhydro-N-acetylmuramyl-L-alanine amidase AmpD [Halomonas vilamensis]|uniref:1,6-anhydro-N-acetylmuramyl-L-alanine amidase AmpD n=1 Tax=Vreelandella vilamensis TaxID=531309 RepID=A0ABU1GZK2_9GAMM|nr:1,6-anhydro-N-acetylmuramyl-L-alanine amidase AmpD [Halomonas vilamensis]MDR5897481.1 1,6-anhydro-N-acetylmuramyl-L-alanine amidase AmpD [Halomonas vilamensis]
MASPSQDSALQDATWWFKARVVDSPNADERPNGEVSLVVLHAISLPPGQFGGEAIEALFTNRLAPNDHPFFASIASLRVSAHFLIRREGECVQFVDTQRRAWHAGRSHWWDARQKKMRQALNDFSIGIELEGDDVTPFTKAQYVSLAQLMSILMARYPALDLTRITSHAKVAPLRKTDPGPAFDWAYFRQRLMKAQQMHAVDNKTVV